MDSQRRRLTLFESNVEKRFDIVLVDLATGAMNVNLTVDGLHPKPAIP